MWERCCPRSRGRAGGTRSHAGPLAPLRPDVEETRCFLRAPAAADKARRFLRHRERGRTHGAAGGGFPVTSVPRRRGEPAAAELQLPASPARGAPVTSPPRRAGSGSSSGRGSEPGWGGAAGNGLGTGGGGTGPGGFWAGQEAPGEAGPSTGRSLCPGFPPSSSAPPGPFSPLTPLSPLRPP